jgi:hypothetical protein
MTAWREVNTQMSRPHLYMQKQLEGKRGSKVKQARYEEM